MLTKEQQIEKRLNDMPQAYRGIYRKAMRGKSLRSGVRAFCLECVGWQREEIKLCTDKGCPLYPYRYLRSYDEGTTYQGRKPPESKKSPEPALFDAQDQGNRS